VARRQAQQARAQPPTGEVARGTDGSAGQIRTIPNLISFARLLGVPLFLYLFLGAHADVAAIVVLAVGGTSDWIDGYVARRLRQVSRLGELLDPLADRLYILATLFAFTVREVVPWQFTAALLAREAVLVVSLLVLRRYGYGPPPVHYVGKTATFLLLAAFPVLLLAATVSGAAAVAGVIGWALAWWGLVLYWVAGALYLLQTAMLVRAARRRTAAGSTPAGPASPAVSGNLGGPGNPAGLANIASPANIAAPADPGDAANPGDPADTGDPSSQAGSSGTAGQRLERA
jgi:cardiolipin synthase